jgi:hypothetical protein
MRDGARARLHPGRVRAGLHNADFIPGAGAVENIVGHKFRAWDKIDGIM